MGRRREDAGGGLSVAVLVSARAARGAARGLGPWLAHAAPRRARGSVAISVTSDTAMRRLNRTFRQVDQPTDVLSFPAAGPLGEGDPARGRPFLGDIAIARGVADRQARAHGHALRTELRILALHGLLHLLGYDHDADQGEMRRLEERLRRRAGLPTGLTARSTRTAARR